MKIYSFLKKLFINLIFLAFLLINQNLFFLTLIFYLLIVSILNKKINFQFTYLPLVIYFLKLTFAFFENITLWKKLDFGYGYIFSDIYKPLHYIKCNFLIEFYNSDVYLNSKLCGASNEFDPLLRFVKLNFYNFNDASILFGAIIFLSLSLIFYLFVKSQDFDNGLVSLLFLSPALIFAFNQLNLDTLVFILFCLALIFRNKNYLLYIASFLSTLLKLHPIFSIFGLFLYSILNNKKLLFVFNFATMTYVLYFVFSNNSEPVMPSNLINSTGLLTISQYIWVNFLTRSGGYRVVILIYILILFLCFNLKKIVKYSYLTLENPLEYSLFFWLFGVFLYANYDYRNIIIILFILIFNKKMNTLEINLYVLYLFLSPIFNSQFEIFVLPLSVIKVSIFIYLLGHILFNFEVFIRKQLIVPFNKALKKLI